MLAFTLGSMDRVTASSMRQASLASRASLASQASMQRLPAGLQELAEFQRGVISSQQALQAGLTRSAIRAQLDSGRWQRVHRGVFAAVNGEPGWAALLWAAVLRAGPDAVLSHYTAAELHGMTRRPAQAIHLTVPAGRGPSRYPG